MIRPVDPRLRLIVALMLLMLLTLIESAAAAAVALGAVIALHVPSRQAPPWRRLMHLEAFLLLLFVTLPFTIPGAPIIRVGPFTATDAGLWQAVTLACKVTASVLLLWLMFGASDALRLATAMRSLRVPETLVRLFVTTLRYITLIGDEFQRLREAMRARAFRPRSNRHTWRSYGYLVGMLIVRALDRADRIEEAMRLRGYSGRMPRAALAPPARADWMASAALVTLAALLVVVDRW